MLSVLLLAFSHLIPSADVCFAFLSTSVAVFFQFSLILPGSAPFLYVLLFSVFFQPSLFSHVSFVFAFISISPFCLYRFRNFPIQFDYHRSSVFPISPLHLCACFPMGFSDSIGFVRVSYPFVLPLLMLFLAFYSYDGRNPL